MVRLKKTKESENFIDTTPPPRPNNFKYYLDTKGDDDEIRTHMRMQEIRASAGLPRSAFARAVHPSSDDFPLEDTELEIMRKKKMNLQDYLYYRALEAVKRQAEKGGPVYIASPPRR